MKAARLRTLAVLGFAAVCTFGCGTINNLIVGTPPVGPQECTLALEVYGGVRSDLGGALLAFISPYPESLVENIERVAGASVVLFDVPFSAIGDTLTLGQTIPAAMKREKMKHEQENP